MFDYNKVVEGVKMIIDGIGEDVNREGLIETPDRIARMYQDIFSSIEGEADDILSKTFTIENDNLVIEKDISFYSMCEHHFLPFYGVAHIAYIPNKKVVGLSKLARTVEFYSKKPQLQERLSNEIAQAVMNNLDAKGVMVVMEAEHLCMSMRGVKNVGAKTETTVYLGQFKEDRDLRKEVFEALRR